MVDINHVVLVGRLTRDAELKSLASGQSVCKFSIAVNRRKKNGDQWEDEVNYFDVVLWGRQGESVHQYLLKGKMVGVDGELKQDRWTQDGQTRQKVEIICNNLQLLGGNPASGGNSGGGNSGAPASQRGQGWQSQGGSEASSAPADDNFADDIPF
jgi:single-strand DNA-binding protein